MTDTDAAQVIGALQQIVTELRDIKTTLREIKVGMTTLTEKKPSSSPRKS